MNRLWRQFTRWRHGRGFGVHSPLAYDLLTNVLNAPEAYYGDACVEALFDAPRDLRRGRALLRLVARFHPRTVSIGANVDRRWVDVVRRTDSRAKTVRDDTPADMYIVADPGFEPPAAHPCVTVYLARHRGDYRRDDDASDIDNRLGPVVVDNARDMAVAVRRRGLSAKTVFARF